MNFSTNHTRINHPNLALVTPESALPYGKLLPVSKEDLFESSVETISCNDLYLPNFSMRIFEGKIVEDVAFANQNGVERNMLGSCIFLKGHVRSMLRGQSEGPQSKSWSQNFKYDPNAEFVHYCARSTDIHFMHLSYKPRFLYDILPDEKWADALRTKIDKRERILGDKFADITLTQEQALKNIFECPLEGKLGWMMMETSIIQILLIQMHALFCRQDVSPVIANRKDMETMYEIKEYLSKTFLENHALTDLAREFALNTNKLMNLFKKAFGKSVFEYIATLRMDHAMHLLQEHDMIVADVARIVGYKNPNHFSSAFKRRFGISPSDVK